ncbi:MULTISPECIES: trigger factor [Pseudanabaena]|jgi:trigger factor|uniref:trigger factor n=1 Tax=Pseudanabaena TaxID=1152 RepID=UPI002478648E|nr:MULTISPECIES: trigger factor [Pseudanabaena]MEA5488954.1 trigger factor [Pseudanabaena sp. CCNP1317]WGS73290.1 trigger factor [Pseudanabaena galeata CCNP1313]
MKVTLEKLPASQIGFDIQVEGAKSQAIYDRIVKDLTRTMQVPGFRKGKAPTQIVLRQVGSQRLKANVLEELLEKTLNEALAENKEVKDKALGGFQLITDIETLVQTFTPGQEVNFKAAIDVEPEVTLNKYQGFTVKAEEIKPDLTEVDRTLNEFQVRKATIVPIEDRPVALNDVVTVDLKVLDRATGEELPDAGEADFQLDVDEKAFIPEVVQAIVGAEIDSVVEVESIFPEEYYPEEYVGKEIKYVVTIKSIKGRELPALDDEFAQSISDKETISELRELLEKRVIDEAESKTQANKERAVLEALTAELEVDLPATLLQQELDFLVRQQASYLQERIDPAMAKQLFTKELVEEMRRLNQPEAVTRLRRKVALDKIAEEEKLAVDEAALKERVASTLEVLKDPNIDPARLASLIREEMRTEIAVEWLIEHSEIELVEQGSLKPEPEAIETISPETDADAITVDATSEEA